MGLGAGLGLQEYMATVNDGQEDELQVRRTPPGLLEE